MGELMRTIGISPKLIAAVIAAVIAQLIADPLLELPAGWDYVLQVVLTALGVYVAPPGDVEPSGDPAGNGSGTVG
jgi:hypothetical protein